MATQQQARSTLVAVGALSAASTLCLARVFSGWGWFAPVVAASILPIVIGAAGDRWIRRTPATALLAVVLGVVFAIDVSEPGTTAAGFPTFASVHAFRHDFSQIPHVMHTSAVPVPAVSTALLLAVLAAWATSTVSYAAATRFPANLAPIVAPLTVFVTVSALGTGRYWPTTAAFAIGIAWFLVAQQRASVTDRRARFHASSTRSATPIAWAAAAVVVAVGVALLAGPTLPGARSKALLDYRRLGGANGEGSHLVVVTPLVDIRDRLTDQSNEELFTVSTNQPTYWRIAGLDTFDGNVWGIAETQSQPIAALDAVAPSSGNTLGVNARIATSALAGPWVPVPYRPISVSLAGARVLPSSSTVIVRRETAIGSTYTVIAQEPAPTIPQLDSASVARSPATQSDLELPSNFPDKITRLAASITESSPTSYQKARALQDYLRNNFKYSTSVPAGHSDSALSDFLFVSKTGFCEQFAGAFAAMARAIGLPTRVAVGFTTGTQEVDGLFHVKAHNAHAWPEVDFSGIGWVRFEPTPGRFDPTPGDYTGTGAEKPVDTPSTTTPGATSTPPTSASGVTTPGNLGTLPKEIDTGTGTSRAGHSHLYTAVRFLILTLGSLAGLALLLVAGVLALKSARRARRRRAADGRAQIGGAWDEALERLAEAGVHRRPSTTPVEFAMREAPALGAGAAGPPLLALARLATTARYAPDEPDAEAVGEAWTAERELTRALRTHVALRARVRRRLDPRVLRRTLPPAADTGDDGDADDALTVVSV